MLLLNANFVEPQKSASRKPAQNSVRRIKNIARSSGFGRSDLFRISDFGLRISRNAHNAINAINAINAHNAHNANNANNANNALERSCSARITCATMNIEKIIKYVRRGRAKARRVAQAGSLLYRRLAICEARRTADLRYPPYALANAYDPDQVRAADGSFSADVADAVAAAQDASALAHQDCSAEAHERVAKLHRVAAQRHADAGNDDAAAFHEAIAKGHDAFAASVCDAGAIPNSLAVEESCRSAQISGRRSNAALPASRPSTLVLTNAAAIDDDGWGLIAPFGEHPKTRLFRDETGQVREQKFIQVLDNEAADAMVAKENSFFRKLKRAIVGIPVYKGHGDLNDADPAAISNESKKIKLGVVDQIRKSARGIEAHFALDNEGAKAVEQEDHKYPSAFWWVLPNGTRGNAILAKPFKLISVALTPYPNISGVESLANARQTNPATSGSASRVSDANPITKEDTMKKLLLGWLAARGVALANDAADETVLKAFEKHVSGQTASLTSLGYEKTLLKITALENEKSTLAARNRELATAIKREQAACQAERRSVAEALADLAIHRGIKTVAERNATIQALANTRELTKDAIALLTQKPAHTTTTNGRDVSGKQHAALENEQETAVREYQTVFAAELPLCNQDATKAHASVMKKYPTLAEKFRARKS